MSKMASEIPYAPLLSYSMLKKVALHDDVPSERLASMRQWLSDESLKGEFMVYRIRGNHAVEGAYAHRVFAFNDYGTAEAFRTRFDALDPWY